MSNATVRDLRSKRYNDLARQIFTDPDGAPNLDGIVADGRDLRRVARLFSAMAEYCDLIALASAARLEGRIMDAIRLESRAETIYNRLPQGARW